VFSEAPSYHYLHAAVSNRIADTPDNSSRGPLHLSENPSPSFPEYTKRSRGGELNPKVRLQEETQMDPGLGGGGKHHIHYPRRIIKQIFKAVELSLEEPSFPNQSYQESKIICPSAFISTELCRGQASHREIFNSCFCRQYPTERKLTLLRFYCSKTGRAAKPSLKHSFVLSEPCCKPAH